MEWLYDNLVLLSVAVGVAAALCGLIVLALSGLRFWRAAKRATRAASVAGAALTAEVDRLNAAVEAMPTRAEELQRELTDLRARGAALSVLAGAASDLMASVRSPLGQRIT